MKNPRQKDEFKEFRHPFVCLDKHRNSYLNLRDMCHTWRLNEKIIERDIILPFMFEFVQFGGLVTDEYGGLKLNADQSVLLMGFIKHLRMFVWRNDLGHLLYSMNKAFVFLDGIGPDQVSLYEYAHTATLIVRKKALITQGLDKIDRHPEMKPQVDKSIDRAKRDLAKLELQRVELEGKLFA